MSLDLRRFEYALEPLRRRWQWQLDALQGQLGAAQREIAVEDAVIAGHRERLEAERNRAAAAAVRRLDPSSYPCLLHWLGQLRDVIEAAEVEQDRRRERRAVLQAQCVAQQRRLEALERHREECVAEHVVEEARRDASEADRDWLVRRGWAGGDPVGAPLTKEAS
jgi:hypothetical protein